VYVMRSSADFKSTVPLVSPCCISKIGFWDFSNGPKGEAAKATDYPEFKETFKERIERLASEKKASGRAKMMAILDAEKRKAQAKAGM
jgi:tRNA A37 methylthiotransferase MiaB